MLFSRRKQVKSLAVAEKGLGKGMVHGPSPFLSTPTRTPAMTVKRIMMESGKIVASRNNESGKRTRSNDRAKESCFIIIIRYEKLDGPRKQS